MIIEGINPVLFHIGPLAVRWYGLMFALSVAVGLYTLRKHGLRQGFNEDALITLVVIAMLGLIVGARAVYVLTNWQAYAANPVEIIRVDHGGLAFHGGLLGGVLGGWLYCSFKRIHLPTLLDLAVPGIAVGIMLVRIANIFNQEILGRETTLFFFERHPTQIYGSLIGLSLLLIHNYLARRGERRPGNLFWHFVLYYTLLRGLIEETFRHNPLALWGYVNEAWGVGFFTAVHLLTPLLALLAWWMIRRTKGEGGGRLVNRFR
jgi:phosphatidylglycerol---prolipoprotein diacylglyceryl transferase